MSEKQIDYRELIKSEYIKCVTDPIHFIRKYCFIQHPKKGRLLFNLYPFQEKLFKLWDKHDYTIINKSRQLGISTCAAGYALWLMNFHKDKNILCIATKQETAKNLVKKVQFMYEELPSWLKEGFVENNKLSLRLKNGSVIKATTAASDSARSEAVSLLIIDEAAFIEGIEEIWASAQQTLSTGGKCFAISTPYGTGNWFHRTFVRAEEGTKIDENTEQKFIPIKLPWYVHPERDEKWRKEQDDLLGDPKIAAQECDANFETSGDTVFPIDWLKWIEDQYILEPIEKRGVDQNYWIWEPPDYSKDYLVVVDVSRGDGKDFSAIQIIDIEANTQVAEFRGHLSPKELGHLSIALATEYNHALLVIENNNMGWATLDVIIESGYKNLYYSIKGDTVNAESYFKSYDNPDNLVPGFTTSTRLRPLVINKFREYVGDKSTTIRSKRLVEEMKVFVWKNGRADAQYGYTDDLIMSYSIAMWLRDTSLRFQQHNLDLTRSILSNIKRENQYSGGYTNRNNQSIRNPYEMPTGKGGMGGNEDITWLLK